MVQGPPSSTLGEDPAVKLQRRSKKDDFRRVAGFIPQKLLLIEVALRGSKATGMLRYEPYSTKQQTRKP